MLERIRAQMQQLALDGFLITNPHNIRYMSGFSGSGSMILLNLKRQCLLVDSRYVTQARLCVKDYEIVPIQGGGTLYNLLITNGIKSLGFEMMHLTFDQYDFMSAHFKEIDLVPTKHLVMSLRSIKTADEIQSIRMAAKITQDTFNEILNFVKKGQSELDIAFEIERQMRCRGAENTSFRSIVASGLRSALPHGLASDKIIEDGEFLTLDYGCIYNGYCSDITRTIVIGKSTEKQRKLYELVYEAQTRAINSVKQDLSCGDLDAVSRSFLQSKGYGTYFTHGLGHGIGIEVHEFPRIVEDSNDVLKAGMTLALEPGVYIEQYGGVRIEDMILVTVDGYERLTKAPEHLIEI